MHDIIVVGGGHAGCEAALAGAKIGLNVLLITGNLDMIASMPCNPSIGGPAKGIIVREIDALGGMQGKVADETQIQTKMLNASKGPAVRALRMQADRIDYPKQMRKRLESQKGLEILEGIVYNLDINDGILEGVVLQNGEIIKSKVVILTTGTYLKSKILQGHNTKEEGPDGEPTQAELSKQLQNLGFEILRLKTGTPARLRTSSIDFSKTSEEPGSPVTLYYSFDEKIQSLANVSLPCHLLYTTKEVHNIIRANLDKSAMYGGMVEGTGPRYCPSIEDKIVRFSEKERHQIFLEPESIHTDRTYIQGFSTSMPKDIQEIMIRSLPGLENCEILNYAYAIEYDAINPTQLLPTLQTKLFKNLYTAGQINATSGYEEAAAQGLMAGINASCHLLGKEPLILGRHESYIGVLIDDLITKGTKEPYRLLTSRAEYRLLLRHDNADLRLREYGYMVGLINEVQYAKLQAKKQQIKDCIDYLQKQPAGKEFHNLSLAEILKRPEITADILMDKYEIPFSKDILEQVEIEIKYEGYIAKAFKEAEKLVQVESRKIPFDLNYDAILNLALEAKEKLKKIRPLTIGQAMRISGVNPVDIAVLSVYLKTYKGEI